MDCSKKNWLFVKERIILSKEQIGFFNCLFFRKERTFLLRTCRSFLNGTFFFKEQTVLFRSLFFQTLNLDLSVGLFCFGMSSFLDNVRGFCGVILLWIHQMFFTFFVSDVESLHCLNFIKPWTLESESFFCEGIKSDDFLA